MRIYEIEIGGKIYQFRITARRHEELDKLCGGNAMKWMQEIDNMMDPLNLWAKVATVGLKGVPENGEVTKDLVYDLYDQMIDDGMDSEEISKHSMKILEESGFFPKGTAEQMERSDQTEEGKKAKGQAKGKAAKE